MTDDYDTNAFDELKTKVSELQKEVENLRSECNTLTEECPDGFINTQEMSIVLKVSNKTLSRWRTRGLLPFEMSGKCCIYPIKKVIERFRRESRPLSEGLMPEVAVRCIQAYALGRTGLQRRNTYKNNEL